MRGDAVAVYERRLRPRDLARLLRRPPETVFELGAGHDLLLLRLPRRAVAVLNHPRLVEDVFAGNGAGLRSATFAPATATRLGGESIPLIEGDAHGLRRRLIEPVFSERDRGRDRETVADEVGRLTGRWLDGRRIDLTEEMQELMISVLGRLTFGEDYESNEATLVAYHRVSRAVVSRFVNPLSTALWRMPVPLTRRFDQAKAEFNSAVDRMVEARREPGARGDLLTGLVGSRANGHSLSNAAARDEAWTYFSQGAPDVALTWTLWLVGAHPEVEAELHREVDGALARHAARDLAPELVPYAHAVVLESLRLYPPGLFSIRTTDREYELAGHRLPNGTMIVLPIWSLHHDERFWPDPFLFDPGRWMGERRAEIDPLAFVAFGAGPRRCPARGFVENLLAVALALLSRSWRFRPEREQVERAYVPFLRPKQGIPATLERRDRVA